MLVLDKVDVRAKENIKDRKRHSIMIKESIHQENNLAIFNVYPPNNSCKIHEAK